MTGLVLMIKFFCGLFLLFVIGGLIGHIFKLDQYYGDIHSHKNEAIKRLRNEMIKITPVKQ